MNRYLIVVDMQKDFVDGALGSVEAQGIVKNVVNKIKNWDGRVIVTMDTHSANYLQSREGKYLPIEHCIKGNAGWMLDANVNDALKDKRDVFYLEKPSFGTLELVNMLRYLQDGNEEFEVELIGLCTDICVVSNALVIKAAFPEISICVDASCCAGVSVEGHEAALKTMQACQIDIL